MYIYSGQPYTCVFLYVRIAEEVHITFQAALFIEPFWYMRKKFDIDNEMVISLACAISYYLKTAFNSITVSLNHNFHSSCPQCPYV